MKLEIYEPQKVGYVSLNPYEWEYDGRYPSVNEFLNEKPIFYKGVVTEHGEGERKVTDDREYLERISRQLKLRKIWDTKIIDG